MTSSPLRVPSRATFLASLPGDAAAAIAPLLMARRFRAGEHLLRAGEMASLCFFIERGLVREHYVDDDGNEHTRSFLSEGQITGSLLDLLSGAPSVTFIEALEDTDTLAFSYADVDALCARVPSLHAVLRRSAEALYVKKTRREHEMLALEASERYARFCVDEPDLQRRVRRRDLASYLGITPEHLSRIARARTARRRA